MTGVTPGQASPTLPELVAGWREELAEEPMYPAQHAMHAQLSEVVEQVEAAIAAQQPHRAPGIPLRSDAETAAMLRADLADAEAQLARWPKCPAGCPCRIGTEDADRLECGCDGPCTAGPPQPAPEPKRPWLHTGCGGRVYFDHSGGYCAGCEAENLDEGDYAQQPPLELGPDGTEPPVLTLYRAALERLADEDTPVLATGLGGGAREELHVRASFAAHTLGRDTCGCTECLVSLGLDGDQ